MLLASALNKIKWRGDGASSSKAWSWTDVAYDLDAHTNLVERLMEADGKDIGSDSAIDSELKATITKTARTLQKLGKGVPTEDDRARHKPKGVLRDCLLEYILFSERRAITEAVFYSVAADYFAAEALSEFLWRQNPNLGEASKCIPGAFVAVCHQTEKTQLHYLELTDSGHPLFLCSNQWVVDVPSGSIESRKTGWALTFPTLEVMVFGTEHEVDYATTLTGYTTASAEIEHGVFVLMKGLGLGELTPSQVGIAQEYVNLGSPPDSSAPHKVARKSTETISKNAIFFRRISSIPGFSDTNHATMDIGADLPKWGEFRFSHGQPEQEVEEMKGDANNKFGIIDTENIPELILTIRNCDFERFKELVDGGADVNVHDPKTGLTPLHLIAILTRRAEFEVLKATGCLDFLARDNKGWLPSIYAGLAGDDPKLFEELQELEFEADPNHEIIASVERNPSLK